METWKFLTTINGIYNIDKEAQEYNILSTLLVYTNKYESTLKIEYAEIEYYIQKDVKEPMAVKKGEILLKDIGESEMALVIANINESWCKDLVLSKYLDYFGNCLNYQKVY